MKCWTICWFKSILAFVFVWVCVLVVVFDFEFVIGVICCIFIVFVGKDGLHMLGFVYGFMVLRLSVVLFRCVDLLCSWNGVCRVCCIGVSF